MKSLLAVLALVSLAGCVVAPPGGYYGARAPQQPYDPYQWHTVSVEPVNSGGGYPTHTETTTYVAQPVYMAAPAYVAPPLYAPQPYYYEPALTFGLGVLLGNAWSRGSYGGRGYYRGHHGR